MNVTMHHDHHHYMMMTTDEQVKFARNYNEVHVTVASCGLGINLRVQEAGCAVAFMDWIGLKAEFVLILILAAATCTTTTIME